MPLPRPTDAGRLLQVRERCGKYLRDESSCGCDGFWCCPWSGLPSVGLVVGSTMLVGGACSSGAGQQPWLSGRRDGWCSMAHRSLEGREWAGCDACMARARPTAAAVVDIVSFLKASSRLLSIFGAFMVKTMILFYRTTVLPNIVFFLKALS